MVLHPTIRIALEKERAIVTARYQETLEEFERGQNIPEAEEEVKTAQQVFEKCKEKHAKNLLLWEGQIHKCEARLRTQQRELQLLRDRITESLEDVDKIGQEVYGAEEELAHRISNVEVCRAGLDMEVKAFDDLMAEDQQAPRQEPEQTVGATNTVIVDVNNQVKKRLSQNPSQRSERKRQKSATNNVDCHITSNAVAGPSARVSAEPEDNRVEANQADKMRLTDATLNKLLITIDAVKGREHGIYFSDSVATLWPETVEEYNAKISHPNDPSTIQDKLRYGRFSTNGEVREDIILLYQNCKDFNGPEHALTDAAQKVMDEILKELPVLLESKTRSGNQFKGE